MAFQRAVRERTDLRMLLYGPPGSGKTLGALKLAEKLADRIGLIEADTDGDIPPSTLYADAVTFDADYLEDPSTDEYLRALADARRERYPVLVIDGLTEHWQWLLDWIDEETQRQAEAKGRQQGNKFSGWGPAGKQLDNLVRAIRQYPGHIIATAQGKDKYRQAGKEIVNDGMTAQVRDSIPARFDIVLLLNPDHSVTVDKSRCQPLAGAGTFPCLWEQPADILTDWLGQGATREESDIVQAFRDVAASGDLKLYQDTLKRADALDLPRGSLNARRVNRAKQDARSTLEREYPERANGKKSKPQDLDAGRRQDPPDRDRPADRSDRGGGTDTRQRRDPSPPADQGHPGGDGCRLDPRHFTGHGELDKVRWEDDLRARAEDADTRDDILVLLRELRDAQDRNLFPRHGTGPASLLRDLEAMANRLPAPPPPKVDERGQQTMFDDDRPPAAGHKGNAQDPYQVDDDDPFLEE